MRGPVLLVTLLWAALGARPAQALVRVASDGQARLRGLTLVLGKDEGAATFTLSGTADLRGRRLALLVPVFDLEGAPVRADDDALDDLRAATGPQLEERLAKDPCEDIQDLYQPLPRITLADRRPPVARGEAKVEVIRADLAGWAKRARVTLDDRTHEVLAAHLSASRPVVALVFTPRRGQRGLRLPAIQWRAASSALDLAMPKDQISLGQTLPVHLIVADVAGLARPEGALRDLGTRLNLPEIAFEAPRDLVRGALGQAFARAAGPVAVRVHADSAARLPAPTRDALALPGRATVARYALQLGRGEARPPLKLQVGPMGRPFVTTWIFRRLWRTPLRCPAAPRYANIVRMQQRAELLAMSALTGQRIDDLAAESAARGYAQRPDGSLRPVKIRRPGARGR